LNPRCSTLEELGIQATDCTIEDASTFGAKALHAVTRSVNGSQFLYWLKPQGRDTVEIRPGLERMRDEMLRIRLPRPALLSFQGILAVMPSGR
jgi:hypothetical protein